MGAADHNFFKKYDRKFVQLSRDICILLHIFEKDSEHSFEDMWLHDLTGVHETDFNILRDSAKQFLDQLEGHYCRAFLEALRDECDERIKQELNEINAKLLRS